MSFLISVCYHLVFLSPLYYNEVGMNNYRLRRVLRRRIIFLSVLVGLFLIFIPLKLWTDFCEWHSTTITNFYMRIVSALTTYVPISLTEIMFIAAVGFFIFFIVLGIISLVKRDRQKINGPINFLNAAIVVFSILTTYQITAEPMYNRKKIEVPLYESQVDKSVFKPIVNHFIDDLNVCCDALTFTEEGDIQDAMSVSELNEAVRNSYTSYNTTLNIPALYSFTLNGKPMYLSSWLYREFHITGVTFIPLGEANINILNVNAGKPFTLAHELAHAKGAMRESDADLIAAAVCLRSEDPYVRYSGYYYTINSMLNLLKYTGNSNDYQESYDRISPKFKANLAFNSKYWQEHNKASEFAEWWNNLYLKASGEPEGTSSYGDSEIVVNPVTQEIKNFSDYQKLYFKIFYNY